MIIADELRELHWCCYEAVWLFTVAMQPTLPLPNCALSINLRDEILRVISVGRVRGIRSGRKDDI